MSDRSYCEVLIPKPFYEEHREEIDRAFEEAGFCYRFEHVDNDYPDCRYRGIEWYYLGESEMVGGGESDVTTILSSAKWGNLPDCVVIHTGQCHYTYPGYTRIWWAGKWFHSGLLGDNGDPVPSPKVELDDNGEPKAEQVPRAREYLRARRAFLESCRGIDITIEANPNINCLVGMRCPMCGSFGPFRIRTTCTALVSDDGTDETVDFDWDDDSNCDCTACAFRHTVGAFKSFDRKET